MMAYKWLRTECYNNRDKAGSATTDSGTNSATADSGTNSAIEACQDKEYAQFQSAYQECIAAIEKVYPYYSTSNSTTTPVSPYADAGLPK